ncbi:MAG: HAD family hydrolase [Selenomonas sp.]|nr:HAD family hydrolase [Selenomonas sp.]
MHPLLQMPWETAEILRKKKRIRRELMEKQQAVDLRIAVLGGSTTRDLVRILELFLLDIGICPTFYEAEYGQWYEEACFDTLALTEFKPQIVYLHTSFADLPLPDTNADLDTLADDVLQRYSSAWRALSDRYGCTIIQNNFEEPYMRHFGNLDATQGLTAYIAKMNRLFADYAGGHGEFFLQDIHYLASACGLANWHDRELYHLYKLVPGYEAMPYLAHNLATLIGAILGRSRKCLVLDLDNTLWGGVIGDDGLGGIQLGHETAAGEGYSEFQSYVRELSERGVVLAVCSKNEESTAREGFTHPDSLLKAEDFASFQANWEPKTVNLQRIAEELGLGLDSFVFLDDNPAERELVRQTLPEVAVPEVDGGHPASYIRSLEAARYFELATFTADDRKRAVQYTANRQRATLKAQYASYDEFLDSLEMEAEIGPFKDIYLDRITQLTNKTNQFNLTTHRYTQAELKQAAEEDGAVTLYGRLTDKFGDNGLVSVVMGHREGNSLLIDLWLMSCRVLKRGLEYAMFEQLVQLSTAKGIQELVGLYYPTPKNMMVKDFYGELGFHRDGKAEPDGERWRFRLGIDRCEYVYHMKIKEREAGNKDER